MALNETASWLIAYDICCPRRLKRVHRFLSGEAVWVQYSIFIAHTTAQKLGCLRTELADLIDENVDDVRIYKIPRQPVVVALGIQGLPEGAMVLDHGSAGVTLPFTCRA